MLLANVYREQKKYSESEKVLLELTDDPMDQGQALYNLTLVAMDLRDIKLARDYYGSLKVDYPKLAEELAFLQLLQTDKKQNNPVIEVGKDFLVKPIEPDGI